MKINNIFIKAEDEAASKTVSTPVHNNKAKKCTECKEILTSVDYKLNKKAFKKGLCYKCY